MIVAIIGDIRNAGLSQPPEPAVYLPYTLDAPPDRELAVRTTGDPLAIVNAVRRKARDLDKDLAVGKLDTLDEVLGEEQEQPRFNMALFSSFALLGLARAAIGIYSVISYNVSQRVQEIGVRMALGAQRGDILRLILLMIARVAALGLAIGLAGAILIERLVRFQMFAKTTSASFPWRPSCWSWAEYRWWPHGFRRDRRQSGSGDCSAPRGLRIPAGRFYGFAAVWLAAGGCSASNIWIALR